MNKEKQINEITNELIFTKRYGTLDAVAKYLYEKGYRKQEWISVEDRLPEKADTYLVSRKDGLVTMTYFCERFHSSVTHWMPLPEPPKMKGGEE